MNVQNVIETESNYLGLTPDERMAIRHLFDCEEDILIVPEQYPDILSPQGPRK
jgi:hypothetical protein